MMVVSDTPCISASARWRPFEIDAPGALEIAQDLGDAARQLLLLPVLGVRNQLAHGAEIRRRRGPGRRMHRGQDRARPGRGLEVVEALADGLQLAPGGHVLGRDGNRGAVDRRRHRAPGRAAPVRTVSPSAPYLTSTFAIAEATERTSTAAAASPQAGEIDQFRDGGGGGCAPRTSWNSSSGAGGAQAVRLVRALRSSVSSARQAPHESRWDSIVRRSTGSTSSYR